MHEKPGVDKGSRGSDYLAVGHVTLDLVPGGDVVLGGAVSYAAATAAALGLRAAAVTRCAGAVRPGRTLSQVTWQVTQSERTTAFANRYDDDGRRVQTLLSVASAMERSDIPATVEPAGVMHIAPVIGEIAADTVAGVAASFVGVTPQGWLREVAADGTVTPGPWRVPSAIVARADAIVLSAEDIAGDESRAAWLAMRVPVVVVTLGASGAVAYAEGRTWRQAAIEAEAHDPTGAGDTFAAALFTRLWEGATVADALRFAAGAAAFAVERTGPEGAACRRDVERRAMTSS